MGGDKSMADRSTESPVVSVVLPLYNAEETIERAIESIRKQTFTAWELLVLDDGSTDRSPQIAQVVAGRDPRVTVTRLEHSGLIATLNRGLKDSNAEYVARMDQDDVSLPHRLEKQVAFLEQNPGVAVVGGAAQVVDAHGSLNQERRPPCSPTEVARALAERSAIIHPTVLMRRGAVDQVGGYRTPFLAAEDYDLWLRLSERYKLANIPEIVLRYSAGGSQLSVIQAEQQILSTVGAQLCHQRRLHCEKDPSANSSEVVSRDWLIRNGMDECTIDDIVVSKLADRSWWLAESGLLNEAEVLAHGIQEVKVSPSRTKSRRFLSLWSLGRAARKRRQIRRVAVLLFQAALTSPRGVAERLFFGGLRKFRSRSSGES